ncbi:MAG TPA: ATP-binding protein [Gemmatimonadales bacterium]|nr:ATP-binding protein [Gemmatimonadales bacterium]
MPRISGALRSLRTRLLLQFVVLAGAAVILVGVVTTLLAGADLGALIAPLVAFWAGSTVVVLLYAMHLLDREVLAPLKKLEEQAEELELGGSAARRLGGSAHEWDTTEFAQLSERYHTMAAGLLDAQSQVVRSAKLAGIGQLAAGVAHEVRNPLGAVATYAEVLRRRGADATVLDEIRIAVDRIEATVASLLDYARPAPRAGATDPAAAATTAVGFLRSQGALRDHELELDAAPGAPTVAADRHELEQVIVNLVLNARDAAARSIRVEVRRHVIGGSAARRLGTKEAHGGAPRRQVTYLPEGSAPERRRNAQSPRPRRLDLPAGTVGTLIVVADDGPGVPDADREAVFDPFFTTKDPGRGTGLGLAIVARTVDSAGGMVWVDRAREGGAAFKIFLPAFGAVSERCAS